MNKFRCDPIRVSSYNEIKKSYSPFGSKIDNRISSIFIKSTLNEPIFISLDGIDDNFFVDTNSKFQIDCSLSHCNAVLPVGTQIYHKIDPSFGEPTDGSIYLTILYAE